MQGSKSSTRGRAASASLSSRRHHHQRVAFRGPLSLLWLALSVGTGPAACFVVLPISTRVATASPLPKVVLGSRPGARNRSGGVGGGGGGSGGGSGCTGNGSRAGNRNQRRLYAFARGRFEKQEGVAAAAGAEQDEEKAEDGIKGSAAAVTSSYDAAPTGIQKSNARTVRAVAALSRGKGFRAAATALRVSASGTGAADVGDVAAPTDTANGDAAKQDSSASPRPKRILILMSDTGGGHRASSQALSAALENLYGDQIHTDIVDIWTDYGRFPFADAVRTYQFLGKRPLLWKLSYDMARFPPTRRWAEVMANLTCHRSFRQCFEKYEPDLVVSTHPLCHHVPLKVLKRLRKDRGKDIPFVTVVTDLGSAHPTWFDPRGDLTYVPSDVLRERAHARGVPRHKLVQFGLPVRDAFWEETADKQTIQQKLGLQAGVRTALIVGGGDGVGKLHDIATKVADRLASDHHPGQVVVVCGTNAKIKAALEAHNWPGEGTGVNVRVLGFVSNMDEWMSASDLLVTKAGPGTIAEACTRGLPVILSSFLPGQEAGNVPYVTDNNFGLYRKDPTEIAHEVSDLLADKEKLEAMGENARSMGRPHATLDIARSLVSTMLPGTTEVCEASLPPSTSM
ncbi:unnamed protein product [Pylaiella littoralis]